MLTDKELDEIEARLSALTESKSTAVALGLYPYLVALLADAVALLAEVRRARAPLPIYYGKN